MNSRRPRISGHSKARRFVVVSLSFVLALFSLSWGASGFAGTSSFPSSAPLHETEGGGGKVCEEDLVPVRCHRRRSLVSPRLKSMMATSLLSGSLLSLVSTHAWSLGAIRLRKACSGTSFGKMCRHNGLGRSLLN